MGWASAALQAGTALFGASQGRHAAGATTQAGQQSIAEWQRSRDSAQAGQQPYTGAGQTALGRMSAADGGDYSPFNASPDYLYARQQMQDGMEHGAAARGRLFSGGALADFAKAENGLASQNYGQWRSGQMGLAQLGQGAATTSGQFGMDAARGITNGLQGIAQGAQDRAGANMGLANSLSGIGSGLLGSYGSGSRPQSFGSSYSGSTGQSNMFGMPAYNSGTGLGAWH